MDVSQPFSGRVSIEGAKRDEDWKAETESKNELQKYRINPRNRSEKFKFMKKALFSLIHEKTNCSFSLGNI